MKGDKQGILLERVVRKLRHGKMIFDLNLLSSHKFSIEIFFVYGLPQILQTTLCITTVGKWGFFGDGAQNSRFSIFFPVYHKF